jgi:hypothetical protein
MISASIYSWIAVQTHKVSNFISFLQIQNIFQHGPITFGKFSWILEHRYEIRVGFCSKKAIDFNKVSNQGLLAAYIED